VPAGWRVSYKRVTPCINPIERFSLIAGDQVLMIQERLDPVSAELSARPRHFSVEASPSLIECCSMSGHVGWVLPFGDHGRAFYAFVYPGRSAANALLRALDSFSAG
jgi:hypothetical protein